MASIEKIGLTVAGRRWTGWTSVTIERGIEQAAAAFSIALTTRSIEDPLPLNLQPGISCVLTVSDEPLMTGIVDKCSIGESANDITLSISGRSKTMRLIKNSHAHLTGEFLNLNAVQIIQQIAKIHGIDVVVDVAARGPIPRHRLQFGETAFAAIERLARDQDGWLLTDDASGRLVLTTIGTIRGETIEYGKSNALSWHYEADSTERYTHYLVYGQKAGDDTNFGFSAANSLAEAWDRSWTEEDCPLTLKAEREADNGACQKRANWEAARRVGKSTSMDITMRGWRQNDGTLWSPNTLHKIVYPRARVDKTMLLVSVKYNQGTEETAELAFAPPSGFSPEPKIFDAKEKKRREGQKGLKGQKEIWHEDWFGDVDWEEVEAAEE